MHIMEHSQQKKWIKMDWKFLIYFNLSESKFLIHAHEQKEIKCGKIESIIES